MGYQIWQYRAVDQNMNVVEGEIRAQSFEQLVISLRQEHQLQVLEAIKSKKPLTTNSKISQLEKSISVQQRSKKQYIIKHKPSWWIKFLGYLIK